MMAPFKRSDYPKDWEQIRQRILQRAGNKCEECGVINHAVGARDKEGTWRNEDNIHRMQSDYGYMMYGDFPDMIRIVLTISHTNHDITDNRDENLRALCQRCHNRHDAPLRAKRAAITRRRNRENRLGQATLFEDHEE